MNFTRTVARLEVNNLDAMTNPVRPLGEPITIVVRQRILGSIEYFQVFVDGGLLSSGDDDRQFDAIGPALLFAAREAATWASTLI